MNHYFVNEIFYSIQGEGVRGGTPNLFVRFSGCNQKCRKETHGFDCDTEFVSGREMSMKEIMERLKQLSQRAEWVILTGGEPALQITSDLIQKLHKNGFKIAIETNGSVKLPTGIDWITVSPKVAEHAIRQLTAHEVKYVRHYGQGIPKTRIKADYYLISPAFSGDNLNDEDLGWCIRLVQENPKWRLSVQQHKFWGVR